MKITLNLATRPFSDLGPALKRLRIAMGVLGGIAIFLFVGLHLFDRQAAAARAREHTLDGQIARVEGVRARAEAMMRQPDNARLLSEAQTLNELFDAKAFSWTLAMENMETVLPGGVQVTSIEPIRAKDGHITVHLRVVGARDRADDLVSNLEHSKRFLLPRIVGENAESSNGPGHQQEPISASSRYAFDLLAEYNPPMAEERAAEETAAGRSAGQANPPHVRAVPAFPQQIGRGPYRGPSQATALRSGSHPTHGAQPTAASSNGGTQ